MAPHTKAGKARVSRATSLARDIVKRRERRYKTEQQKVVAKKRRLDLHTSYHKAPPGYAFLPVGTPELAERCKELSRQRGLTVNVVNAEPHSEHVLDPEKVAHHVHRIGYHFKTEVIENACQELGYILFQNKYIKASELQQQRQNDEFARTLAKYGVTDYSLSSTQQESRNEVRAAIKELFPKIPEQDLGEIVSHAWEEGTGRVGNTTDLPLSRRVQLATVARIRHKYTDYDRLLRAFEWKQARSMVEPDCLKKLIEWRGENDAEEDQGLEEIVRETIVIDDDDDLANDASEADDEDSGNVSDTSIEITHQVISLDDFGAESDDEKARSYANRVLPRRRNIQQRNNIAKQKINATKQRLRNAGFSASKPIRIDVERARHAQPARSAHSTPHTATYVKGPFQPEPDEYGRYPEQIIGKDGQLYRLVNPSAPGPQHQHDSYRLPNQAGHFEALQPPANVAFTSLYKAPAQRFDEHSFPTTERQHVVASIERDEFGRVPNPAGGHQPITPDRELSLKRRWNESEARGRPQWEAAGSYCPAYNVQPDSGHNSRSRHLAPPDVEVMDLTTPERRRVEVVDLVSPHTREHCGSPHMARDAPTHAFSLPSRAAQLTQHADAAGTPRYGWHHALNSNAPVSNSTPYDPTQPMLHTTSQHVQALTPVAQAPHHDYGYPAHTSHSQPTATYSQQPPPQPREVHRMTYEAPRPVHGAPAPFQWAPIAAPTAGHAAKAPAKSAGYQYIPANGAVAPTQYYHQSR